MEGDLGIATNENKVHFIDTGIRLKKIFILSKNRCFDSKLCQNG